MTKATNTHKLSEKDIENLSNWSLIICCLFLIFPLWFTLSGEVRVGTEIMNSSAHRIVAFAEKPTEYLMVVILTWLLAIGLFTARHYVLRKLKKSQA